MSTLSYTMAFLMGLTGSLHCAGMCGPIMLIMPFQAFKGLKKATAVGLYHLGRISVYAILAIVLHSFRNLFNPKIQQYISIGLGALLLLVGILSFFPGQLAQLKLPWTGYVKKQLGNIMGRPGLGTIAMSGMLNGLLPCGLVYMGLSATLAASSAVESAAMMYFFGLGTVPMLVGITILKNRLSFIRGSQLKRMVPVIVFAFGCLFVLRGMNLGIPYLSPKIVMEQHEIRSCCSHHKH